MQNNADFLPTFWAGLKPLISLGALSSTVYGFHKLWKRGPLRVAILGLVMVRAAFIMLGMMVEAAMQRIDRWPECMHKAMRGL